jgi:hypothetical protein
MIWSVSPLERTPDLGQMAKEAGLDPLNIERWTSFEKIPENSSPCP